MHSNPTHPSPVLRCSADGLAVSGPELSWENEGGHLRAPRGCREMSSRPLDAEARNRLADEHALLLHQVAARADDVLAADAANRWPRLELAGLIDNLRSELIGQTRIRGTTAVHRRRHHFGRRLGPGSLATTSGCGAPWKPSLTPEPPVGGETRRRQPRPFASWSLSSPRISFEKRKSCLDTRRAWAGGTQWLRWSSTRTPGIPSPTDRHQPRCLLGRADHRRGRLWRPAAACVQQPVELVGSADPQQLCSRLLRDSDIVVRYLTDGPETWRVTVTRRPPE